MKRIIFVFVIFLASHNLFSQDVLPKQCKADKNSQKFDSTVVVKDSCLSKKEITNNKKVYDGVKKLQR